MKIMNVFNYEKSKKQKIVAKVNGIYLSEDQWKKFEEIMSAEPRPLSDKLKEAAQRLDEEGLTFTINEETK